MQDKVIYEVLRVIDGKPIFLEKHLKRMENSFKLINQECTVSEEELSNKINTLISKENKSEGNIKITYDVNKKILNVFFVKHSYPSQDLYENGVKAIFYFGERKNPNAKVVDDNFREKVTEEIMKNNAYEAVLVDRNGYITEGSKSNIFMVKDKTLLTSPTKSVLPGVTREEVIEVARKMEIKVEEVRYSYKEVDKLDGMFICGTSPNVLPISLIDGINLNENDECIRKIMKGYKAVIINYIKKH